MELIIERLGDVLNTGNIQECSGVRGYTRGN
jgi:hypothetical protein